MSVLRDEVLARRRRWLAARALEAALIGGGVAALTLAAQRVSGPATPGAAALPAALCAALACAALLRERWRDEREFTRRLDARLGVQGALVTACEVARRGADEPLADLLGVRTAEALARSGWRGAASPPSALAAAGLLAGLALFAAVGRPGAPAAWSEVQAALGDLEGLAAAGETERDEVERALERLQGALAVAQAAPARVREVERRLELAVARLEAPAGSAAGSGGEPGAGGAASAGTGAGGASGSGTAPLAAGAGERTMSRPPGPGSMEPQSPNPPGHAAGAEITRAATWPRRHDAVVAGYLERRPRD